MQTLTVFGFVFLSLSAYAGKDRPFLLPPSKLNPLSGFTLFKPTLLPAKSDLFSSNPLPSKKANLRQDPTEVSLSKAFEKLSLSEKPLTITHLKGQWDDLPLKKTIYLTGEIASLLKKVSFPLEDTSEASFVLDLEEAWNLLERKGYPLDSTISLLYPLLTAQIKEEDEDYLLGRLVLILRTARNVYRMSSLFEVKKIVALLANKMGTPLLASYHRHLYKLTTGLTSSHSLPDFKVQTNLTREGELELAIYMGLIDFNCLYGYIESLATSHLISEILELRKSGFNPYLLCLLFEQFHTHNLHHALKRVFKTSDPFSFLLYKKGWKRDVENEERVLKVREDVSFQFATTNTTALPYKDSRDLSLIASFLYLGIIDYLPFYDAEVAKRAPDLLTSTKLQRLDHATGTSTIISYFSIPKDIQGLSYLAKLGLSPVSVEDSLVPNEPSTTLLQLIDLETDGNGTYDLELPLIETYISILEEYAKTNPELVKEYVDWPEYTTLQCALHLLFKRFSFSPKKGSLKEKAHYEKLIQSFLQLKGLDIKAQTRLRETYIQGAIAFDSLKVVSLLLAYDPRQTPDLLLLKNKANETPLMYAKRLQNEAILEGLTKDQTEIFEIYELLKKTLEPLP
jgi:hypothetical protein